MAEVNVSKKYVVYELNKVMNSKMHMALEKVEFTGMTNNSFDTEEEAIQALINEGRSFVDFVILKHVFIRSLPK